MKYKVRAINHTHQISHFHVESDSQLDVLAQLENDGYTVLDISEEGPFLTWLTAPRQQSNNQVLLFSFNTELLALMNAGLSLIESLEVLLEKESNTFRAAMLNKLVKSIRHGKRFSIALAEQPNVFPKLYIGIIKASEETSDLPNALSRYIAYTERGNELRRKIVNATIYPGILLLVGATVILFLIAYVVPRFSEVYRDTGRNLPWMSQLLLSWGYFFQQNTKSIAIALTLILVALLFLFLRSGSTPIISLIRKMPAIKDKLHLLELSRLYMTLGMLLEGGIAITEALLIVQDSLSEDGKKKLSKATHAIIQGQTFSTAFSKNDLTTPISFRLLRVGEKSGQLGHMLEEAGKFQEAEISTWIERFSKAFEPSLMAFIGFLVGAIVILLYMPIFDLAGSLS